MTRMTMDDDSLIRELAGVFDRVDPVPADVTLAARSAIAWRRMDAELAQLLEDAADERELAGTRGDGSGWRALTFEAATITIEVEVAVAGRGRTVLGQIVPAAAAQIVLRQVGVDAPRVAATDDLGRFRFDEVAPGPISLRVEHPDGNVETGWVTV